jgi:DNA-binding NarL/FixJ family response regulator
MTSGTGAPLRVVVVDDEPLARERVATLVRSTESLELVGEANNGLSALDLIAAKQPDLLLIDVEMPELSGFGVIATLEGERVAGRRLRDGLRAIRLAGIRRRRDRLSAQTGH